MRQIGFKNFRRFANHLTIDFGNINLLVGGNNSGKSTVVKALLLITENLRALYRDSDFEMFLEDRDEDSKKTRQYHPEFNFAPNILHNALHIGTFERAINVVSSDDYIIFSVSYGKINIAVEVVRNNNDKNLPTSPIKKIIITDTFEDSVITVNYIEQSVNFTFKKCIVSEMSGDFITLFSRFLSSKELEGEKEILSAPYTKSKLDSILKLAESKISGNPRNKSVSNRVKDEINRISKNMELYDRLKSSEEFQIDIPFKDLLFHVPFVKGNRGSFYYFYMQEKMQEKKEKWDEKTQYLNSDPIIEYMRRLSRKIERSVETPLEYLYAHAVNQNTLYRINSQNDYMSNTIQEFFCANIKKNSDEDKFIRRWMGEFNIASNYEVQPVAGCEAYTVRIGDENTNSKKWLNLAEKGMGSIQMMVLLFKIATLIKKYKSYSQGVGLRPIILIEEPEQNLHPSLQSKLADLFFEINEKYKIRFIVETHSEYLIRRAQVLVGDMVCMTQDETDEKNPFKVFYFPENGVPYDMGMAPTGKFLNNFDEGFFDVAAKLNMEVIRRERKK
ncbi:MAG: AAA family ATPase [Paludibacteraceae bacterium]|nr:AAA family ATPase [Paludibacteraceae bacterium]